MRENVATRFDKMISRLMGDDSVMDLILTRTLKVVMIGMIMLVAIRLVRTLETMILKLAHRKQESVGATGVADRGAFADHPPYEVEERDKRLATVLGVVGTSLRVTITVFGIFMVMKELGFDITPLLTGAGIAGVALGFGSQSLVKDIISGSFLLLENQIRIGDSVKIGSLAGTVERMELRVTVLRDLDGTLHIIPNGEIKAVSNMTYQWGRAVVEVPLAYQANVAKAVSIVTEVCNQFQLDEKWKRRLLGPLQVQGITDFSPSDMKIRVLAKTGPHDRFAVQTELRLRVKEALDQGRIPMVGTVAASPLSLN